MASCPAALPGREGRDKKMKTTEYMFRVPGCGDEQPRYSVIVVHGVSVTFIRIGASQKPFSLMVPRVHDETFAHARAEHLARLAIAQAIYTELFEAHPECAVDLEVHGPLWDGDLDAGQWQHGMADAAPTPGAKGKPVKTDHAARATHTAKATDATDALEATTRVANVLP
jgi:hypothetical protein